MRSDWPSFFAFLFTPHQYGTMYPISRTVTCSVCWGGQGSEYSGDVLSRCGLPAQALLDFNIDLQHKDHSPWRVVSLSETLCKGRRLHLCQQAVAVPKMLEYHSPFIFVVHPLCRMGKPWKYGRVREWNIAKKGGNCLNEQRCLPVCGHATTCPFTNSHIVQPIMNLLR